MKKLMISFIALLVFTVININTASAKEIDYREVYDQNKEWTITFSAPINITSINSNNVYIKNNVTEELFPVKYRFNLERNKVTVVPLQSYPLEQDMTLYIENVTSKYGKKLKESTSLRFKVFEEKPIEIIINP